MQFDFSVANIFVESTNGVSLGWDYLFDQPLVDVAVFGDAGSTDITLTNIYFSV